MTSIITHIYGGSLRGSYQQGDGHYWEGHCMVGGGFVLEIWMGSWPPPLASHFIGRGLEGEDLTHRGDGVVGISFRGYV